MILVPKPSDFTPGADVPVISGNINIEFPTINKNSINAQFEPVYTEKTMISGKIIRVSKGYRLHASWDYAYLSESQIIALSRIINEYDGKVEIQFPIPTLPYSSTSIRPQGNQFFNGYVYMSMSGDNNRHKLNPAVSTTVAETYAEYVWKDFSISIVSENLI